MKRIHFDGKGPVNKHYFFWEPWGCGGCLLRGLLFLALLFGLLYLLSQLHSCSNGAAPGSENDYDTVVVVEAPAVPPINDDDIIDNDGRRIVSNRLNVLFDASCGASDMERWTQKFDSLYPSEDYQVLFSDVNTKLMALQVPSQERSALITRLPRQIPDIPFMVFEEEVMENGENNADPFLADSRAWYFAPIQANQAWERITGVPDVIVAVIDSYFDIDNKEFEGVNIVSPYSVADGTDDVSVPSAFDPSQPDPVMSHGTMVAATAIGKKDNGYGSAGVGSGCSLMPISLGNRFGCFAMLQGMLYAINKGAKVINFSAGISLSEEVHEMSVDQQIEIARTRFLGMEDVWKYVFEMADRYFVTIVWAAGNEDVFTAIDASKRGDKTIKVSAVDQNLKKAEFSNFGNFADRNIFESTVSAPGVQLYGETPGGGRAQLVDGTSFSAPIVAGAVGLMKSIDPTLTTQEISGILRHTGRPVEGDSTIGPVIQIRSALDAVDSLLMSYSGFRNACEGSGSALCNATLLYPKYTNVSPDSTSLIPLVTIAFKTDGNNSGEVQYRSSNLPDKVWKAPFTVSESDGHLVIRQTESAVAPDSSLIGFSKADFYISTGSGGYAVVDSLTSETLPWSGTFLIRKPAANN